MILQTVSEQGTTWIAFQIENQAQNHIVGLHSFSSHHFIKTQCASDYFIYLFLDSPQMTCLYNI